MLKYLSDDETADKTFQLISDSFELYEQLFISDESLYEKKKAVKRSRNSELIMMEGPIDSATLTYNSLMTEKFDKTARSHGFDRFMESYTRCLAVERSAVDNL